LSTLTDITSGNGLGYNWVLLIEGFELALTNYANPSTASTMLNAASWDWSDALGGLCVLGGWEQELRPWDPQIQVGSLTFSVQKGLRASTGAESDLFAERVFGAGAGGETYLTVAADCNDTTITVKSTAACVGAATSGTIHIGTEAIAFTGVTATTFTGCVRGKYAPFKANTEASQRFGQPHRIPNVGDNVIIQPKVTSLQRDWRGRRVGLWMVSYGTTSWSDAQLMWAGRIADYRDGTNGCTYLECVDIKAQLRECELMRHQFEGRIQEGIYLQAGWRFTASDVKAGAGLAANDLVVSDSPSGSQIQSGVYTLDELADTFNGWFADEKTAGRLNFDWTWSPVVSSVSGPRSLFRWADASSTDTNIAYFVAPPDVVRFMGFRSNSSSTLDGRRRISLNWEDDSTEDLMSGEEPRRLLVTGDINALFTITVEDIRGTRFDARTHLPNLGVPTSNSLEWGVFQVGGTDGPIALFSYDAADQVTPDEVVLRGGVANQILDQISGVAWSQPGLVAADQVRELLYSEEQNLDIRQVGLIGKSLTNALNWIVASTGTDGYNHATHDKLPQQLGAGVPWELLGDDWTSTVSALSTGTAFPITLYIPKPTKLMSVIGAELVARVAQIIWKDEGLRIASWGTPTAARSLHTFTEANKRTPSDARDAQRTPLVVTDKFLVNRVRMKFGRGEWAQEWTIIDPASQDTHGNFGKEVLLPSVSHESLMEAVEETLEAMVPFFSRPLHVLTRSLDPAHYENCAPGDFCTITDNFARDPSTGSRGLSSKPGLIIRHAIDWGGFDDTGKSRPPNGVVDILVLPLSNIAPYSPCAEVDETQANAGYDAGNQRLTLKAHEHSESSETADAARFAVGAVVRVVEIDPADPATPLTWTAQVSAQSGNTIDLDTALTGWDNTKLYRVISDVYSNADSTQTTDVYQADDADAMVEDTIGAYVYGTDLTQAGTWTDDDGAEQVALYSEYAYGDGAPLNTGYHGKDAARLVNNMVNYRTAVISPMLNRTVMQATVTVKRILAVRPLNLHPGALMLGERLVYVRPMYRSNDGTSVTISVSLCSAPPTGTSVESGDADAPAYQLGGSYETKTWTTTSTTWGYGSEQSFSGKIADSVTGKAYLVIESNSTKLETRGLPEVWQAAFNEAT
jgi:hypothetical protein